MPVLTDQQQRFVDEYLVDYNATQAALRAGYSPKTANQQGARLLANVGVKQAIRERNEQVSKKLTVTKDQVVGMMLELYKNASQKIPKVAFDGEQITDDQGRPVWKMQDAATAAKAVDMLAKHVGAYDADNKRELAGSFQFVWAGEKHAED